MDKLISFYLLWNLSENSRFSDNFIGNIMVFWWFRKGGRSLLIRLNSPNIENLATSLTSQPPAIWFNHCCRNQYFRHILHKKLTPKTPTWLCWTYSTPSSRNSFDNFYHLKNTYWDNTDSAVTGKNISATIPLALNTYTSFVNTFCTPNKNYKKDNKNEKRNRFLKYKLSLNSRLKISR